MDRPRVVGAPSSGVRLVSVQRPSAEGFGLRSRLDAATGALWLALGDAGSAEVPADGEPGERLVAIVDVSAGVVRVAQRGAGEALGGAGGAGQADASGAIPLDGVTPVLLAFGARAPTLDAPGSDEELTRALADAVAEGGLIVSLRTGAEPLWGGLHRLELSLGCELEAIETVNTTFDRFAADLGVPAGVRRTFDIAFDDLINNVVSYGFPGVAAEVRARSTIEVAITCDHLTVEAELSDEGVAYDPFAREAPDTELDLDDREIGGLGVHLVKSMMDDVAYARRGDRNVITLRKSISPT